MADTLPLDTILHGDCLAVLRTLPDASVDAIVSDPPCGIGFMGASWDTFGGGPHTKTRAAKAGQPGTYRQHAGPTIAQSRAARESFIAFIAEVMTECRRVIKPGGHALIWALPRTSHWTGTAIEDAGWEIREKYYHLFGSGFPKSLNISKAIDRMAGAERQVVSEWRTGKSGTLGGKAAYSGLAGEDVRRITAPATDAAKQWEGWGTALKPAVEPIILARKPLSEPSIAANVLRWGVGALHVDACRVAGEAQRPFGVRRTPPAQHTYGAYAHHGGEGHDATDFDPHPAGRWPPHLLLSHSLFCDETTCADDCPVRLLGEQSGERTSGAKGYYPERFTSASYGTARTHGTQTYEANTGTAARYFPQFRYVAKASRSERNQGCEGLPITQSGVGALRDGGRGKVATNHHPTVKPIALMRWLITLITPPGGIVLDPFAGSGTTCLAAQQLGMHWLGIEQELDYLRIAEARLSAAHSLPLAVSDPEPSRQRRRHSPSTLRENDTSDKVSQDCLLRDCG